MPNFLMFENFEMPNFSEFQNQIGIIPKMELFDFWAFQNFMKMLSHDKIIFHMLFWAFHITPRIVFDYQTLICELMNQNFTHF